MPEWRNRIVGYGEEAPDQLLANEKNWRIHPFPQQQALTGVLDEVGYVQAAIVNKRTGANWGAAKGIETMVDGHLRCELAISKGQPKMPVVYVDLDPAEEAAVLATFDPLSAMAATDPAKLDSLLKEFNTGSAALQEMLSDLAQDAKLYQNQEVVEDEVPEPPNNPVTKPGDLWLLGEHRLLCGDSRDAEQMAKALAGSKANCIFTDPPYGVSVGAKNRLLNSVQKAGWNLTDIVDDDLSPEDLEKALLPAMVNIRTVAMDEDCTLFVCSPQGGGLGMMMMMMQNAGLRARHVLIWKKNSPTFSMGRLDYDYQHEPILLTWLKRHKRPMHGQHRTSVWEIDKPRASPEHPTMKPVALYANAYLNNSEKGDVVFDAYAGSGTMFIAAEQLQRRAIGIEREPNYCDVIVERWEKLTGKKAHKEGSQNGKTRSQTTTDRSQAGSGKSRQAKVKRKRATARS